MRSAADGLVHFLIQGHAQHLCKHQRHDAVAIHSRAITLTEVAVVIRLDVLGHELQSLGNHSAFWCRISWHKAHAAHAHDSQRSHCTTVLWDCVVVVVINNAALPSLLAHEESDGLIHALLHSRGDGRSLLWKGRRQQDEG